MCALISCVSEEASLNGSAAVDDVDNDALMHVVSMGFEPSLARMALKSADNNVETAIEFLLEHADRCALQVSIRPTVQNMEFVPHVVQSYARRCTSVIVQRCI